MDEAYEKCAPKTLSVPKSFIGQNFELAPVCIRITAAVGKPSTWVTAGRTRRAESSITND